MRLDKTRVDVIRNHVGVKKKDEREMPWEWLYNNREKIEYLGGEEKRRLTVGPNKRTSAMQINLEIGQKFSLPLSHSSFSCYLCLFAPWFTLSLFFVYSFFHIFSSCHPPSLSSSLLSTFSLCDSFISSLSIYYICMMFFQAVNMNSMSSGDGDFLHEVFNRLNELELEMQVMTYLILHDVMNII